MIGIEPRCTKSYPSALALRVLPLNKTRKNQKCKNSFGASEDLSQDFKIVSLGTLSRPFGTLREFFLGHYWTFYCNKRIVKLSVLGWNSTTAALDP